MSEAYKCGHPYTDENTYFKRRRNRNDTRQCKTCEKVRMAARSKALAEINRELKAA